jgi:FtsP/CotA-like multicopper oxidase with cupredoxin domain
VVRLLSHRFSTKSRGSPADCESCSDCGLMRCSIEHRRRRTNKMKALSVTHMAWVIATLAVVSSAHAGDDLADIVSARPCSSITGDRVAASGNCAATTSPKGLSVSLKAETGSVTFKLPDGIAVPGTAPGNGKTLTVSNLKLYNGALAPEIWRLNAGDVLKVRLQNGLVSGDEAATNLHTHGLLVSPDLDIGDDGRAVEPVGDSVYVCTIPAADTQTSPSAAHCKGHGSVFGKSTSEMNYELAISSHQPEGLYWYHPHVHMNARPQVGSGLSGLIYIKGTNTAVSGGVKAAGGPDPVERFLMLKDIQVGGLDVTNPAAPTASFLPVDQHDAGLCGPAPGEPPPTSVCFADPASKNGWLFTVNGQLFPRISIPAGKKEIWRIANVSADMTYDLALIELGTGRPLRLQVLARDGVAAVPEGGSGPLMSERVLLMPGSRIEVGVDRGTAEGLFGDDVSLAARLRTYGFFTGGSAGFGDGWPAVDLAEVQFEAAPGAPVAALTASPPKRSVVRSAAIQSRPGAIFRPLEVLPWKPADPMERSAAPSRGSHSHPGGGAPGHGPAGDCKALPAGEDRIIVLAIDKSGAEKFEIGADHASRGNPIAWEQAIERALSGARQFGDQSVVLCAHAGTTETWTIVNRAALKNGAPDPTGNNETHNFHVHQLKFEVLDVEDPTGRVTPPLGGPNARRRVDSFPVPIGGSLRIKVAFTRQQLGGRFVFHCHILEHEDKGMMAEIEVREP